MLHVHGELVVWGQPVQHPVDLAEGLEDADREDDGPYSSDPNVHVANVAKKMSKHLLCGLTQKLMVDPVVGADGKTYERAAIEQWLSVSNVSPKTNVNLESRRLIPNHALRQVIEGSGLLR